MHALMRRINIFHKDRAHFLENMLWHIDAFILKKLGKCKLMLPKYFWFWST
jgi:hypothetical protein